MTMQDLLKIFEAQQKIFVHLERQVLHLASVAGQQDNEGFNADFDGVLAQLEIIKKVIHPGTEGGE